MVRGSEVHPGRGPHFICIGPANSATTWLADQLKLQWDVWLPPVQEASYLKTRFRNIHGVTHLDVRWDWWSVVKRLIRNKSILPWRDVEYLQTARELAARPDDEPDLDGYLRLFAPARDKLTGDIAPIYATFPVEKIRRVMPVFEQRRIFTIVRDPVQRFWSAMGRHYRYKTFGDGDYGSIEMAKVLFADPERSRHHFPTRILDRWNEALGDGGVEIFYFDDIVASPESAFEKIVTYIGADPRKRLPLVPIAFNRKQGNARPKISAEAREWVEAAFQEELAECAGRFGDYGRRWLERYSISDRGNGWYADSSAANSGVL